MLQLFGFDRIGILLGDLYFIDPGPEGQEGAEHGVRIEVRLLEPGELTGSIYSARPIRIADPIWRADLLETVEGTPGSMDRAHHHPQMEGWEPRSRAYDPGLSADPVGWVGRQLSDLKRLLGHGGVSIDETLAADAERVRAAVPDVQCAISALLEQVWAGKLGTGPDAENVTSARVSWL